MPREPLIDPMEASSTYQAILEKGAVRQARKTLMRLGRERLGSPPFDVTMRLELIDNLKRLEELTVRLLRVDSWEDLIMPDPSPTYTRHSGVWVDDGRQPTRPEEA